jgi:hypothetical protein
MGYSAHLGEEMKEVKGTERMIRTDVQLVLGSRPTPCRSGRDGTTWWLSAERTRTVASRVLQSHVAHKRTTHCGKKKPRQAGGQAGKISRSEQGSWETRKTYVLCTGSPLVELHDGWQVRPWSPARRSGCNSMRLFAPITGLNSYFGWMARWMELRGWCHP